MTLVIKIKYFKDFLTEKEDEKEDEKKKSIGK